MSVAVFGFMSGLLAAGLMMGGFLVHCGRRWIAALSDGSSEF